MAAIPYYAFGEDAKDNIALSISSGPLKVTVEIMLLLHLVAAFPILLNPPAQYFENLMEIPLGKLSGFDRKYKYLPPIYLYLFFLNLYFTKLIF